MELNKIEWEYTKRCLDFAMTSEHFIKGSIFHTEEEAKNFIEGYHSMLLKIYDFNERFELANNGNSYYFVSKGGKNEVE